MDAKSAQEPLLFRQEEDVQTKPLLLSSGRWILRLAMSAIFIAWVAAIFVFPCEFGSDLYLKAVESEMNTTVVTGIIFLIFSAPVVLIAFLATPYLALSRNNENHKKKNPKYPQFRLWTFPVLVDGPFGVVTAAELAGIFLFVVYLIWALYTCTLKNIQILPLFAALKEDSSLLMMELTGLRLGTIGIFCLAFLFLPIARGSMLLRLVDIPFEHATRYHVWLGHLTMALFTLHGLFYMIPWAIERRLTREMMAWNSSGVSVFPGVIGLIAGLALWATSLPGVRRRNFELFFYTHQLYIVFMLGLALHVGERVFCFCAGGVLLFLVDRFLRFCQSRRTVEVLSARCFPCGTLELVLSKPANLHYNALSWIFLQVRELSWLQWHPFSVSSTPLAGNNHIAVLIKVLGNWTERLQNHISSAGCAKMTASVEGPYGHESPYYLTYENLILVAGGIGISPFLAILSDVLHRVKDGKPCLPRKILIVWAIKKSDELPLLQTIGIDSLYPASPDSLNIEIQTYVTRESGPSLEDGKPAIEPVKPTCFAASGRSGMSVLVGTGNPIWSGLYVFACTIGFIVIRALLDVWYIIPYKIKNSWYKGLLLIACMIAGVVIFGGLVIGAWHLWGTKSSDCQEEDTVEQKEVVNYKQEYVSSIRYGERPDFGEIFESMCSRWGSVDIGVMVCGPPALQTSVAKECRTQNLKQSKHQSVFHFNSHSFDL
ncbi:ferric reduction oxidase 6-like [Andrographis paniculata]|uniref:ferric reduction oxidase 6-like n=1 Tax=Andrographis paniculata TaxID=175694 RepID=UPI0021E8117C|nr:ferric reduction oxidase 6-like [Andrographis paniculata]